MYTTIMLPLDGSSFGEHALLLALGGLTDARYTLLQRSAATLCAPLSLPKRWMEQVALEKNYETCDCGAQSAEF